MDPRPPVGAEQAWLLTATERGNAAATIAPSTTGNALRALVDGRSYFAALAGTLRSTGHGDLVLLVGWRVDADRVLDDDGLTLEQALRQCVARGTLVRGLVWRSHPAWLAGTLRQNRRLIRSVNAAGGELLADHRVRALGSHHQKLVVVRHRDDPSRDVAYVGGIDLARARGDDSTHGGDPVSRPFAEAYGPSPPWHDVQLQLRGPAVADAERVFRERWDDPESMTRLPWHRIPDRLRGLPQRTRPLPDPIPPPPAAGSCTVQLLRTYPNRHPGYPFAPDGERGVALGMAKALERAERLVYLEDQYLWSAEVAELFARALRRKAQLQIVAVAPRMPDQEGLLNVPPQLFGQAEARRVVEEAGPGRVHRFDIENSAGWPVYVHAKVTIVDDQWAAVGSSNLNRRSWTHDSELTAAIVDAEGAFPRGLRLRLMAEHLDRDVADCDLRDPSRAVEAMRACADALDEWHRKGCPGPRPPGRLRTHVVPAASPWHRRVAPAAYNLVFDPDGRPWKARVCAPTSSHTTS